MTRLDGTGPNGEGPKTGLGKGNCNTTNTGNLNQKTSFFGGFGRWFRGRMGAGRGQGGGQGKGMGKGQGRGQGRGMGKGFGR